MLHSVVDFLTTSKNKYYIYIACDNPSRRLSMAMQAVFVALIAKYLDPVHLVI